jgi:hypothetical protein
LGLLTHGYREWQWFANASDKFCINRPLFAVNTLKLASLVLLVALAAL